MNREIRLFLYLTVICSLSNGQSIISADPFYLFTYEQEMFLGMEHQQSLLFRPLLKKLTNSDWLFIARNEYFFNDNSPNLENMGNRWVGKGIGVFSGFNLSHSNKYISFSIEPYFFIDQNQYVKNVDRKDPYNADPDFFNVLNDNRISTDQPYVSYGFRESILFFHYNDIGFGISNANMWWGPGIHSSLTMTNNTSGFPYFMIGNGREKRFKNIGTNFRYLFSKLDKVDGDPFYTSLIGSISIYSEPKITIGLNRNYLSGGLSTDRPFTAWDAALLPFESLFIDTKKNKYPDESIVHDPWDETMVGYITLNFHDSGLQLFAEVGTNDHRQNWSDLRSQPDHAGAYVIGLRKYGLLKNQYLIGGFEYLSSKQSYTSKFRIRGNWYDSYSYHYSSYEGRRWTAHSGSDSDDFYFFFGYNDSDLTFIPGFNYERHGIVSGDPPEVKIEFKLDIRIKYQDYAINLYLEREFINNNYFTVNETKKSSLLWFGVEKDLTPFISNFSQ